MSANPSSGAAPLIVNFTQKVTLSSGCVTSYSWDFGDGKTSTDALPSHLYQSPGSYTAKLTVTDNRGNKASASTLVSVGGSGSLSDSFNTGSLDTTKWIAITGPAPGGISGVNPRLLRIKQCRPFDGMLRLKLTQQQGQLRSHIGGSGASVAFYLRLRYL